MFFTNQCFWKPQRKYQHYLTFLIAALVNCVSYADSSSAQPIPPTIPKPNQPDAPQPLPSLPEVITPQPQPYKENTLPPEAIPGTIIVKRFELIDNEVLARAEIEQIFAPYLLRPITFIELLEVQRQLTGLCVEKGYITTSARILPQTIEDRVVKIRIVPGTIEGIKISGLKQLNPAYVRSRLEIGAKSPLNQNQLLAALQLLQINPLIDNITAELSQGITPNSSLLEVSVTEADTFKLGINLDNSKVATIGTFNREIELRENNFLGFGDRFYVAYSNTEGSDSLSNLSYELPLSARNNRLKFTHNRATNQIIQKPFTPLNIENKTRLYNLTYTQPLIESIYRELSFGLNLTRETTKTTFLEGENFPNAIGATNEEGETIITTLGFFQDYLQRDEKQVLFARSQFTLGLDTLDSVIDREKPDSEFVAWRGYLEYLRSLSAKDSLLIKSNLQVANDSLVPIQQFSAGGFFSVRGYPQNILQGDNGLFFSTEFRHAIVQNTQNQITLEVIPFLDFGKVWNTETALEQSINTLVAVGAGLKLSVDDNLTAKLDWGIPLVDIEYSGDSLQENGVYFSLESEF